MTEAAISKLVLDIPMLALVVCSHMCYSVNVHSSGSPRALLGFKNNNQDFNGKKIFTLNKYK